MLEIWWFWVTGDIGVQARSLTLWSIHILEKWYCVLSQEKYEIILSTWYILWARDISLATNDWKWEGIVMRDVGLGGQPHVRVRWHPRSALIRRLISLKSNAVPHAWLHGIKRIYVVSNMEVYSVLWDVDSEFHWHSNSAVVTWQSKIKKVIQCVSWKSTRYWQLVLPSIYGMIYLIKKIKHPYIECQEW